MKKLIPILCVVVLCVVVMSLPGASGKTTVPPPVTLRFAEIHEPGYPTTKGDYEIARLVKERTNGRVIIEIYDSMKLGDEAAVIKKIQDGEIDLTRINIGPVTKYVPNLNAFLMPYIFRDVKHMLKVVNGPVGNDVLQILRKERVHRLRLVRRRHEELLYQDAGKDSGGLKNLRIRSLQNDLMVSMMTPWGAKRCPCPMAKPTRR